MPDLPEEPPLYDWRGHLVETYEWEGPAEVYTADGHYVEVEDGQTAYEVDFIDVRKSFVVFEDDFVEHAEPVNLTAIRREAER